MVSHLLKAGGNIWAKNDKGLEGEEKGGRRGEEKRRGEGERRE